MLQTHEDHKLQGDVSAQCVTLLTDDFQLMCVWLSLLGQLLETERILTDASLFSYSLKMYLMSNI